MPLVDAIYALAQWLSNICSPSSTPAAQTTDPLPDARPDARPRHVPQELPAVWARLSPFPPADLAESDAWEAVLGALEHALRLSLNEPEEKAIPETARDVHHVYPISSGPLEGLCNLLRQARRHAPCHASRTAPSALLSSHSSAC